VILGLKKITKCNKIFMNHNRLTRKVLPHYYRHRGAIFPCKSNVVFIFLGTDTSFEVDLKKIHEVERMMSESMKKTTKRMLCNCNMAGIYRCATARFLPIAIFIKHNNISFYI
jgi:hypothetical protein